MLDTLLERFPDELRGYAAKAAATELVQNWKAAMADGVPLSTLVQDVPFVVALLYEFASEATKPTQQPEE